MTPKAPSRRRDPAQRGRGSACWQGAGRARTLHRSPATAHGPRPGRSRNRVRLSERWPGIVSVGRPRAQVQAGRFAQVASSLCASASSPANRTGTRFSLRSRPEPKGFVRVKPWEHFSARRKSSIHRYRLEGAGTHTILCPDLRPSVSVCWGCRNKAVPTGGSHVGSLWSHVLQAPTPGPGSAALLPAGASPLVRGGSPHCVPSGLPRNVPTFPLCGRTSVTLD